MQDTRFDLTEYQIRDRLAQTLGLTISQAPDKVAAAIKGPMAETAATLVDAAALHVDKTKYPRGKAANGVWRAFQPNLAFLSILPLRARYVALGLISAARSVMVFSRYAAYAQINAGRRQARWTYLLQAFRIISQCAGQPGRIGRRLLGLGYVMFCRRE